jgi:uncharacterized 2Fe-2S/4Fe-4S cluster protein (DUF4445 family)
LGATIRCGMRASPGAIEVVAGVEYEK